MITMKMRTFAYRFIVGGALVALLSSPALADTAASLNLANATLAGVDAAQTCAFAPIGGRYDMQEVQLRWAIGPHPSCGVAIATIGVGVAALTLLPHTKTWNIVRTVALGLRIETVSSNSRLMVQWRIK
jgi:hypothetical protein